MGAFLLFVSAVISTLVVVLNPSRRIVKAMKGKTYREVSGEWKKYMENITPSEANELKWYLIFVFLASFTVTYLVQPLYIFISISDQVGNQTVAYAMLLVMGAIWYRNIRGARANKAAIEKYRRQGPVTDADLDRKVKISSPYTRVLNQVLNALPVIYLWYLFGISIRIIQS